MCLTILFACMYWPAYLVWLVHDAFKSEGMHSLLHYRTIHQLQWKILSFTYTTTLLPWSCVCCKRWAKWLATESSRWASSKWAELLLLYHVPFNLLTCLNHDRRGGHTRNSLLATLLLNRDANGCRAPGGNDKIIRLLVWFHLRLLIRGWYPSPEDLMFQNPTILLFLHL